MEIYFLIETKRVTPMMVNQRIIAATKHRWLAMILQRIYKCTIEIRQSEWRMVEDVDA